MVKARTALVAAFSVAAALALCLGSPSGASAALTCAQQNVTQPQPSGGFTIQHPITPSVGHPCWTEPPYPFGAMGGAVSSATSRCSDSAGNSISCYLEVTSFAFRAWNRGIAATASTDNSTDAYPVWLWNGSLWYPDPSFPGGTSCPGHKVMWAGKLDYWVIGGGNTLCRYDGSSSQWEVLSVPQQTLDDWSAAAPNYVGKINTGACYAWDNCWFFGTYGAVVHWDGQVLSDASPYSTRQPSPGGNYTDAVARLDPSGHPFGFAISDTTTQGGSPNGAGSRLYRSQGGAFVGLSPTPGNPDTTDLEAIDFNPAGSGWLAGNPTRRPGPAPLLNLDSAGNQTCPDYGLGTFTDNPGQPNPDGSFPESFHWGPGGAPGASVSVMPDGSAVAGALYQPAKPSDGSGTPPTQQPGIVQARCGSEPTTTTFPSSGPGSGSPATAAPVSPGQAVTAISASAVNDAWAATAGTLQSDGSGVRPHLYLYTDGATPEAPPGDDSESRPALLDNVPPTYVQAPPTIVQAPATVVTNSTTAPSHTVRRLAPIFDVRAAKRAVKIHGRWTLTVMFRVRSRVTVGLEGLRHGKVVASSGLHTFSGPTGRLTMVVNLKRWPKALKFVLPHA